jgi:hypothetical protein
MRMYNRGWFKDSYRHSLAAKGIKTSFSGKKSFLLREAIRGAQEKRAYGEAIRLAKIKGFGTPTAVATSDIRLKPEEETAAEEYKTQLRIRPESLNVAQLREFLYRKFPTPPSQVEFEYKTPGSKQYLANVFTYFQNNLGIRMDDPVRGYGSKDIVPFKYLVFDAVGVGRDVPTAAPLNVRQARAEDMEARLRRQAQPDYQWGEVKPRQSSYTEFGEQGEVSGGGKPFIVVRPSVAQRVAAFKAGVASKLRQGPDYGGST